MNTRFVIPITALMLGSCTLGPDFQIPGLTGGNKWKEGKAHANAHLPDDWWRMFRDKELNRLIDRAFQANNDLAAARSRVETARALVGLDRARMFPHLDLMGSVSATRSSEDVMGGNLPSGIGFSIDLDQEHYRSTFNLAYDPDLWGRNKRLLESSTAEYAANVALLDAQRLGVATEVARQYFLLCGLDAQEAVVQATIKTRLDSLDLQKTRTDAGLTDGLATSQARTELELARNDLALVQRQRGAAEHALAVLCGMRPSDFSISQRTSMGTLPDFKAGLPAEVLIRRPDVRAALERLRSANAQIGAAEAAFYPNFQLTASGGFESLDFKRFLDWQNRVLSIGADFVAPIFDGGTNKANYDAARSRTEEALSAYRQTLLVALREVEDAMVDLKGLAQSQRALQAAVDSSKDTLNLASERYTKGLTSYLEVVEADRTELRTELALRQIESQQRITMAALAKALGGGWQGK